MEFYSYAIASVGQQVSEGYEREEDLWLKKRPALISCSALEAQSRKARPVSSVKLYYCHGFVFLCGFPLSPLRI